MLVGTGNTPRQAQQKVAQAQVQHVTEHADLRRQQAKTRFEV